MHHTEGIPVKFRKSASKILYEDEDFSEGSQDEYHPPACEDPGESDNGDESEAPEDTTEEPTTNKKPARKGKKPKPGRKDVVAARETIADKGSKLKRKADDNEK